MFSNPQVKKILNILIITLTAMVGGATLDRNIVQEKPSETQNFKDGYVLALTRYPQSVLNAETLTLKWPEHPEKEVFRIEKNGDFFIDGEKVGSEREVFKKFQDYLTAKCGK